MENNSIYLPAIISVAPCKLPSLPIHLQQQLLHVQINNLHASSASSDQLRLSSVGNTEESVGLGALQHAHTLTLEKGATQSGDAPADWIKMAPSYGLMMAA